MQAMKKILPAAILAAFAGAAQAQVSLYGLVDMSYGKNEFNGDSQMDIHSGGDDGNGQGNSTTRFGIKGSTDVGSGIKANFKMESGGITSEGAVNAPFFNRQMWLGFESKLGEVRVGRQDNVPYQMMSDLFDFNGASNGASAQAYSDVAVAGHTLGRQSRLLSLYTPTMMGGLKAAVGFQPSQDPTDTTGGTPAATKDTFSGAVTYTTGGFAAGVSGETKRTDTGEDYLSAAASYDFKFVKLMAGYADKGSQNRGVVLGVNVPVMGNNIGTHYTQNLEGTEAKGYEFWVNREVLKNTYVYAEYLNVKSLTAVGATTETDTESFSAGVIYVF
jgi:predicted porin